MPAQYVKAYVKRGKNDAADAEAICEAVTRPTMRFVPVKTPEQQSVMMLHRVRLMLNRQRTQLSNAIRAHLSESGIVAPAGRRGLDQLLAIVLDEKDRRVPADARLCLKMLAAQLIVVKQQILENDRRVRASARSTDTGRRLMEIPGVGPLLASAFVATIADPAAFKTGRGLARISHTTLGNAAQCLIYLFSTPGGVYAQDKPHREGRCWVCPALHPLLLMFGSGSRIRRRAGIIEPAPLQRHS